MAMRNFLLGSVSTGCFILGLEILCGHIIDSLRTLKASIWYGVDAEVLKKLNKHVATIEGLKMAQKRPRRLPDCTKVS